MHSTPIGRRRLYAGEHTLAGPGGKPVQHCIAHGYTHVASNACTARASKLP